MMVQDENAQVDVVRGSAQSKKHCKLSVFMVDIWVHPKARLISYQLVCQNKIIGSG